MDLPQQYKDVLVVFAEHVKKMSGGWFYLNNLPSLDSEDFFAGKPSPFIFYSPLEAIRALKAYLDLCHLTGVQVDPNLPIEEWFKEKPPYPFSKVVSKASKINKEGFVVLEVILPDSYITFIDLPILETLPTIGFKEYAILPAPLDPVYFANSELTEYDEASLIVIFYDGEEIGRIVFDNEESLRFDVLEFIQNLFLEKVGELTEEEDVDIKEDEEGKETAVSPENPAPGD